MSGVAKSSDQSNEGSGHRRASRRVSSAELGIVRARIRGGHDVSVIDVSSGGTLIESSHRLMPGSMVELHLRREGGEAEMVRGRVLRCSVAGLSASGVRYRGAVTFDRDLPWFSDGAPWVCDSVIGDANVEVVVWPTSAAAPA
jgi:hypothetical protein